MNKIKAVVLFSGGLDSLLTIKVLESQGTEVVGVCFYSVFFDANKAEKIAKKNKIKLHKVDFNKEILNLVKNPQHGLGKNMNPCIDCHATMFKLANKFAEENGYDFLASGEVLGQRPFSQNKRALEEVLKTAGVEILRPLSAKLLPETEIEKKGLIDREKLLDFQGRQRNRQIALAKKLGIKDFESPAGGCLLTEPEFSKKLKQGLNNFYEITCSDVELFKRGRIYWLKIKKEKQKVLVVVGRNKEDNDYLEELAIENDFLIKPKNFKGPTALVRIFNDKKIKFNDKKIKLNIATSEPPRLEEVIFEDDYQVLQKVAELSGWYITSARGKEVQFEISKK